ncbi:MAG: RNA polymerase sigma-70 factor [bacterium]|nr:MAG: RNA polymerase sigma-70 factor [bacterium]
MGLIRNLFKQITATSGTDYSQRSDSWLINEWVECHDIEAYTEVYSRYSMIVFDFLSKKVSLDIAEDGVQHCFSMLVENPKSFKTIKNLKNYFLAIGYNYVKKYSRQQIVEISFDEKIEKGFDLLDKQDVLSELIYEQDSKKIDKILNELRPEWSDAVRLRIEGYKPSEISYILSISDVKKVKNNLYQSYKYIKKRLLEISGEE